MHRAAWSRISPRATFDNVTVEGYEISDNTDPNLPLLPLPEALRRVFPAKDMVARLWVDVETSLPVGFELEFNTDRGLLTGFGRLHGKFRATDFQWNAALPEGIFEPNIPEDYQEFKDMTELIPTDPGGSAASQQ